ncbi:MAG TPA: hypothetical protein VFY93_08200 [Planctomycetota bacterium]|nr:hypothetical protein [Planctomycetota bacterium]
MPVLILALFAACSGGGGAAATPNTHRILLTAGMVLLEPLATDNVSPDIDLARLGIDHVARAYDVSTPPGELFTINVLARAPGNAGPVRLGVAHCADGGTAPIGGPETLGDAGIVPSAHDPETNGPWLEVDGNGYVRVGLDGAVDEDQVLAISAEDAEGESIVLLRIRMGEESIINRNGPDAPFEDGAPFLIQTATLLENTLDLLASPAVASADGITNVVAYDRGGPNDWYAYEIRLRHDAATNTVVGKDTAPLGEEDWFGEWRDHELAAKGNVLVFARVVDEHGTLRISFDGGATFTQTHDFTTGYYDWSFRLAQVALGPADELALLFWHAKADDSSDLVLVEGTPSARDSEGRPRSYSLGSERILFQGDGHGGPAISLDGLDYFVPLVIGAQYSEGGDLVVAYGYTQFIDTGEDVTSFTETHCLTRLRGNDAFLDVRVEREDDVLGFDPSLSLLGHGETMTVFVAYEASDGVRMRMSADGGRTFSEAGVAGGPGAHLPSVFARVGGGATRVDLLYITPTEWGSELHVRRWEDFGNTPSRDYRIAGAGPEGEVAQGVPGEPGYVQGTYVEKQVGWFGYDAALDGDDVVVVYIEEVTDYYGGLGGEEVPMPLVENSLPPDPVYLRAMKLARLD